MKQRCYDTECRKYKNYGARGVVICKEWLNPKMINTSKGRWSEGWLAFKSWALSNGYADNLTLDRIDVNGNYEPSNCRWVSAKVQANNRTNNLYITYNGETKTLSQWCEELNLSYKLVWQRMTRNNWSVEKAFTTKKRNYKEW
jgi:hypothetical protein